MMEVENFVETVNPSETPSCLSTDIGRIFHSKDDECKRILEEVDKINSSGPLSTKILVQSSDSIPEHFKICQKPSQIMDETSQITDSCIQIARENLKAISKKYETQITHLLDSDTKETTDKRDKPDDLQGSGSPNAEVSSNEDSSEIPATELTEDSSSFDARRTRRKSKRKLDGDFCCPVCGLTVREPELTSHYAQEVEKLTKISGNMMKLRSRNSDGINTTYVQVKSNRENRLTAKVAKYTAKANKEVQCPICNLRLSGSEEDINKHVVLCVQNEADYDEHIVVDDDDDDETFEEYEIGDQTRIRTISLVSGGYRSLEGPTSKRNHVDESEDLEIDVDDTMAYGEPHELDVIPHSSDGDSDELRKAVLGNHFAQPLVLESRKWGDIADAKTSTDALRDSPTDLLPPSDSLKEHTTNKNNSKEKIEAVDQTVNSLKERIMDLEDQNKNVKCLICLESYTKPVVSTTCWHVHCEECWLMTMGVKKLCPQCNMIVFPSDLRKIYL